MKMACRIKTLALVAGLEWENDNGNWMFSFEGDDKWTNLTNPLNDEEAIDWLINRLYAAVYEADEELFVFEDNIDEL